MRGFTSPRLQALTGLQTWALGWHRGSGVEPNCSRSLLRGETLPSVNWGKEAPG